MNCLLINPTNEVYYEQMLALRHQELRLPLGLDLYTEDLSDEINQYVFIGEKEGEVLVCLLLKKVNNKEIKLRQMATKKTVQGHGLGTQLVQFAERWAAHNNYHKISLHAREYAMPFYLKMDYLIEGEKFEEVGIAHYKMSKNISDKLDEFM